MKSKEKRENVKTSLKEHFKETLNLLLQKSSSLVFSSTFVSDIL